jgi:hypothetical protein
MHMQCEKCSYTGPEGEAHYHITVERGVVTQVDYISASGYWDRELEPDEWFVEYKDDPKQSGPGRKVKVRSGKKAPAGKKREAGKPAPSDWLQPKVYKGKSMAEEELENQS